MSQARQPVRPHAPRCRRGLRAAALVLAAALTVLALAAGGSQRALAATASTSRPASTAVTATATARLVPATPASPSPSPSPQPAPAAGTGGCGFFDFTCHVTSAITGWFAGLVRSAVNPLLVLIGQSALSTPQPGGIPAVHTMWATSLAVADACYVLLVLLGGIVVMSHETVQTSYSVKEIAPRIVLGFLGANLSMVVISRAITIANGLSAALAGHGVDPASAAKSLLTTLGNSSATDQGAFLILLALAGVILALVLAVVYVMRLMAVVLLAAAAPLCLALYALPQTAWAARWWWRALTAVLSIQVAQGLVLTAAVQVFFSPGWLPWHPVSYLEQVLITLCLLYVLMRIPFWIARPVLSPFGHSPVRRAVRFAFTAAVLSRIAPVLRGGAPARGKAAASASSKGKKGKGP
jgi:hypothetical protein